MAQKVEVQLIDDLDGGQAAETITFGLDNVTYEIDLSSRNAEGMRSALEPFVSAARRTGASRPSAGAGSASPAARRRTAPKAPAPATATSTAEPKAIRAWASAQGIDVPKRGRIPESVRVKFQEAGN